MNPLFSTLKRTRFGLRPLWAAFFLPTSSDREASFHRFARAAIGLILILRLSALLPDAGFFFSDQGPLPTADAVRAMPFMSSLWIELAPDSPTGAWVYTLGTLLIAAFGVFGLGVCPRILNPVRGLRPQLTQQISEILARFSLLWVLLYFCIMFSRNDLLWNSADKYLYIITLFLALSPRSVPWGRRMIQIQSSILYLSTVLHKFEGPMWRNGTATYPVLQLPEFFHGPLGPLRSSSLFVASSTWGTLVIEAALCTLIWFPRLRLPLAAAGVVFHLSLDYALNIPLFPWISSMALLAHAWPELSRHFNSLGTRPWRQKPLPSVSMSSTQ